VHFIVKFQHQYIIKKNKSDQTKNQAYISYIYQLLTGFLAECDCRHYVFYISIVFFYV